MLFEALDEIRADINPLQRGYFDCSMLSAAAAYYPEDVCLYRCFQHVKKNVEDAITKIDSMGTNLDELFYEIEKIGLSTFLEKKKETDQKK